MKKTTHSNEVYMKTLILILAITLTGCGAGDRIAATFTGQGSITCFMGVSYIQFTSGATVAYNTDGTIKLCGEKT